MSVSAAPAFKAALFTACTSLFGSLQTTSGDYTVTVFYGWPTSYSDEMVVLGDVSSERADPLMGPLRRREETLTAQVQFLCTIGGTDQQTITERAFYLVGLLEAYLQDSGVSASTQITLGGVVRECWVTALDLVETADEDDAAVARTADITVELTARVHI